MVNKTALLSVCSTLIDQMCMSSISIKRLFKKTDLAERLLVFGRRIGKKPTTFFLLKDIAQFSESTIPIIASCKSYATKQILTELNEALMVVSKLK